MHWPNMHFQFVGFSTLGAVALKLGMLQIGEVAWRFAEGVVEHALHAVMHWVW